MELKLLSLTYDRQLGIKQEATMIKQNIKKRKMATFTSQEAQIYIKQFFAMLRPINKNKALI